MLANCYLQFLCARYSFPIIHTQSWLLNRRCSSNTFLTTNATQLKVTCPNTKKISCCLLFTLVNSHFSLFLKNGHRKTNEVYECHTYHNLFGRPKKNIVCPDSDAFFKWGATFIRFNFRIQCKKRMKNK